MIAQNLLAKKINMNLSQKKQFFNLPPWPFVIFGGCEIPFIYTICRNWLALYENIFTQTFPGDVEKNWKLYSLYVGSLSVGTITAILSAFLAVFILGIFFRNRPFLWGLITGGVGFAVYQIITFPAFSAITDIVYQFLHVFEWCVLIMFCGVAAYLGHQVRLKIMDRLLRAQEI